MKFGMFAGQEHKKTELPNRIPNHIYDFPGEYGLCECGKYPQLTVAH